jgi:hypothetical protein
MFRVSADSAGFEVVCFHTHLQVRIPEDLERWLERTRDEPSPRGVFA